MSQKEQSWFGFKKVDANEKQHLVSEVFSSVASKYDVMNDFMSLGIHRLWKDKMIELLAPEDGSYLLDMAGGTGDISFRFLDKSRNSKVMVSDINKDMLDEGRKRAIDKNYIASMEFQVANAEALPFEDNLFDYYTIAFGIRNVTNIDVALKEAFRVLKPGGKFVCLEFSNVDNSLISKFYDFYSFNIIPKLGKIVAGDADSYRYLVESIRKFPQKDEFKSMIEAAGFENVKYKSLNFGVVAIHIGWKI